jgi:hypothetical protein
MIKPRLTYANVAATLALVFSMTGGALAAKHYLITSTKQISPKVISALKGKAGPRGLAGSQGPAGSAGPAGPAGPAGSAVAFAYVVGTATNPSLTEAKNVSSVSRATSGGSPLEGEYCITTTVPFKNVTGITDAGFGGGNGVTVSADTTLMPLLIGAGNCPAGSTVVVLTGTETKARNANFWISFD